MPFLMSEAPLYVSSALPLGLNPVGVTQVGVQHLGATHRGTSLITNFPLLSAAEALRGLDDIKRIGFDDDGEVLLPTLSVRKKNSI